MENVHLHHLFRLFDKLFRFGKTIVLFNIVRPDPRKITCFRTPDGYVLTVSTAHISKQKTLDFFPGIFPY